MKSRIPNILFLIVVLTAMSFESQSRERSASAKGEFKREHPCPANGERRGPCPGYVIDHIIPLDCGGADDSANMQWQTVKEGKKKDRWERKHCIPITQ